MTQSQIYILVVDDERNIRKNLTMVLEASGYMVDAASDGEEAIAKCKERRPDIAFVDVQMPKMGGLEVLSHIRALSRKTAVVMLTAYGTTKRAVDAMKLGAVDFLEKPFDPKAIELLCEEILQRKQFGVTATVDELLHLADLAQERKAHVEARSYLKSAMLRDGTRPEPYYRLGMLSECKGDIRQAKHYYYMSLDAKPSFQPAIDALKRLGGMDSGPSKVEIHQ
jgi:CheY-like chemotaxis protein